MKSLSDHLVQINNIIIYESPLCSVAVSVQEELGWSEKSNRIQSLIFSYYNQWYLVVDSYQKIYEYFIHLNSLDDEDTEKELFSDYVLKTMEYEEVIRDYAYMFIISAKTHLDLFAALIDIIQNDYNRNKHLTDFFKFKEPKDKHTQITNKFLEYRKLNWVILLQDVRNKLIHGGYFIKPLLGFKKSNILEIKVYCGIDHYTEVVTIDIGDLFQSYKNDLLRMENEIKNIFEINSDILPQGITHLSGFKSEGLVREYSTKELFPS